MNSKVANETALRIFTLGNELAKLLGDKEAIADLEVLYIRHPEMFSDLQDVSNTIEAVIKNSKIAVNADKEQKDYDVVKALTPLNDKKMADVIIKNEKGTNEIFHANKKKISEYTRFVKKMKPEENLIGGENAQLSHPDNNQVRATGISSMRSPIDEQIISQNPNKSQAISQDDGEMALKSIRELEAKKQENLQTMQESIDEIKKENKVRKI